MATGIKLNSTHQRDTNKNPSELSSPQPERLLSKQEKVSAGEREALHSVTGGMQASTAVIQDSGRPSGK